jgi:exodeoxyribonuclease-3
MAGAMRIATWNINGLRARLDFVRHWLERRRPDVVGLQELKLEDDKFPYELFEGLGYRAAVHGQKGWNGVAILARLEPEVVQVGLPGQEEQGARLIESRVGDLSFATIYCPNGKSVEHEDFPNKLAWLDALTAYAAERFDPRLPTVLCGDFNLCPGPLDTWDEKRLAGTIFHTEEERGRYRQLLSRGLLDLYRQRHPEEKAFSWWDYRGGAFHRGLGLRIDLLLGNPALAERVRSVEIDREYRKKKDGLLASDHAPVIADLDE